MTDIVSQSGLAASYSGRSDRVKRRFSAERRFKMIGRIAVLTVCAFLAILLYTIVIKAIPAFTYYYVELDVDLTVNKVDPDNLKSADYAAISKEALYESLPFVSGRNDKRKARGLLSAGADIQLRNTVIQSSDILGEKQKVGIPVSDVADLYLKGLTAQLQSVVSDVAITIEKLENGIAFETKNDDFRQLLDQIRLELSASKTVQERRLEVRRRALSPIETQLAQQQSALETLQDERSKLRVQSRIENLLKDVTAKRQEIENMQFAIKGINDILLQADSKVVLNDKFSSILVRVKNGIAKVTEISPTRMLAIELVPLEATSDISLQTADILTIDTPEANRKFKDYEVALLEKWKSDGLIERRWNSIFFTAGASREPEQAGIWGAVVGSFFTMIVTLLLSFPIGVGAALYLEEFAPKNRLTDIIEVNINNLAAVPSIVFGLLGLAVFLNLFGFQRSIPLVGGMVLALMTLPTIIIASRAALKAVPPSIREAALGVGASKIQTVFHHVLPLAMPGILTGTIIGMAQALGETAPLLMIGMVAFIVDIPSSAFDPSTVLPVQIFMWADFPETAFQQKTSAAILVLLGFLVMMNSIAVLLRKRFERRW